MISRRGLWTFMTGLFASALFHEFSTERLERTLLCWFFRSWASFSRRFCGSVGYDFLDGPRGWNRDLSLLQWR